MRTLRIVSMNGGVDLKLIDELTGATIPDVLRLECHPLEYKDQVWLATVVFHERDNAGNFRWDGDKAVTSKQVVRLRIGTIWSV
jgi:hypothetical protein